MAVVLETTIGDITIDLYTNERPKTCMNFLKLCKIKYYNYNLFHSVQHNFIAQTGDPTGSGHGGESIFGKLYGEQARYYAAEQMPKIKHTRAGLVSMVNCGDNMLGAQFFITLGSELSSLDNEHCVFGEVTEGDDILLKLNESICDEAHRPYQDIRITHTVILEDPFPDPPTLQIPERSPSPTPERLMNGRLAPDEAIDEMQGKTMEEIEELVQEKEAAARATILEIVGDLPDADMAPPENVLFICKLNPVTNDDDLEIIFSRFGKIVSCEVIRDKITGDSLQYAFIEFAERKSCEEAYFKMDNVLIDDRRIHVDFSQSVAKVKWRGKGRGVDYVGSKPGEKVETERHRNDKFSDRQPRHNQLFRGSPINKMRDDKRSGSRDYRRDDLARRDTTRRREDNRRSRERSRSRNRQDTRSNQRHRSRDRDGSDSRTRDSDSRNRDREGSDSRHKESSDGRSKDRVRNTRDKNKHVSRGRSRDRNSRRYSKEREDRHRRRSKDGHGSKEKSHKDQSSSTVDVSKQNHNARKNSSEPETKKISEPETKKRKNSSEPETRKRKNSSESETRKRKNSSESETRKRKTSLESERQTRKDSSEPENKKSEKDNALVIASKVNDVNGSNKVETLVYNQSESEITREIVKSHKSVIKADKSRESLKKRETETPSKKRSRDGRHSSLSESSSDSSSEESSSSSSEPRKRKKPKRKKILVVKKKSKPGKHKKKKVESHSESSSDSSESSSSESESEPRRSKHKKRKTKMEVVKIISRKPLHKKKKRRAPSSSSDSSSSISSDAHRKKKKSRKTSVSSYKSKDNSQKKRKDKNKRKCPTESDSSSSEEPASKKRKSSKKPSKKRHSSESEESSSD